MGVVQFSRTIEIRVSPSIPGSIKSSSRRSNCSCAKTSFASDPENALVTE